MSLKEKLYDAFGELIYIVAMADGLIQKEEVEALERILINHPWAKEIIWSFDFEVRRNEDIDFVYTKVLDYCYQNGPDPEYKFLLEILEEVARASDGIHITERAVIKKFTYDLTERFKRDLEKMG
jgi:hypothetical protein